MFSQLETFIEINLNYLSGLVSKKIFLSKYNASYFSVENELQFTLHQLLRLYYPTT